MLDKSCGGLLTSATEVGGREIKLRQRNDLKTVEADTGKIAHERRRIANENDGQVGGLERVLGHLLNVIYCDGVDPFRIGLEFVEIKTVQNSLEHLRGY